MSTILLVLAVTFLLALAHSFVEQLPPPQVVYVQLKPVDADTTGGLPLLVLVLIILAAIVFG